MLLVSLLTVLTLLPAARHSEADHSIAEIQEPKSAEQEESLFFESAEAGFRIQKPSAVWSITTQPGKQGIRSLSMTPFGQGAAVQFKITIALAGETDLATLKARRDALMEKIKDSKDIQQSSSLKMKVLGLSAPGLQVDQEASGDVYTIRQVFFVAQGLEYQVQYHAPKDKFSKYRKSFEEIVASMDLVPLSKKGARGMKMLELAKLCGSEVEWLEDWKTASRRAKLEKKLIVVTVQATSSFELGDLIGQGPFMDLDIVNLLRHRFIVLRWKRGMGAPFEEQDVFGMSQSTFGNGMLVVTPRGDVVEQVFLLDSFAVFDVLLKTLKGHPKLAVPKPEGGSSTSEAAKLYLESGQFDAAAAAIAELSNAASPTDRNEVEVMELAWLRSELHRLRREGAAAISATRSGLASIAARSTAPEMTDQLQLQLAALLTVQGEAEKGEANLIPLFDSNREVAAETLAPALLLQGALRLQAMDRKGAQAYFNELIDHFPDSRYAWIASAAMTGPGWSLDLFPDLSWPQKEVLHLAYSPQPAESGSKSMSREDMIASAVVYLLESQREDGSWATLSSYREKSSQADDFQLAAAAIAGRSLLRMEGRADCKAAATLAANWLIKEREVRQKAPTLPVVFMDYAVWSRSYGVFFLADCLDAGVGKESTVRALLKEYLLDLQERQQRNGGWSYYLSGKIGGAASPQSISFTTATVVMAFERAKECGIDFPNKVLQDGLNCLEAMRSADDTFGYFLNGVDVKNGKLSSFGKEGSAARGPACTLALIRGERESAKELEPRMELFLKHLDGFGQQRRKALMHAGLHTQGSHYLLYDFSNAAEAMREVGKQGLSPNMRREMQKSLMREIRACRNQDGSFVDNPIIGTSSATGLALNALLDLKISDA